MDDDHYQRLTSNSNESNKDWNYKDKCTSFRLEVTRKDNICGIIDISYEGRSSTQFNGHPDEKFTLHAYSFVNTAGRTYPVVADNHSGFVGRELRCLEEKLSFCRQKLDREKDDSKLYKLKSEEYAFQNDILEKRLRLVKYCYLLYFLIKFLSNQYM